MKYLILVLFTISILPKLDVPMQQKTKRYLPFSVSKNNLSSVNFKLYQSIMTGNKAVLSKQVKRNFKRYGIMHLLTPSGLHFSSLFFLKLLPSHLFLVFIIGLFIYLSSLGSYFSLERILIFHFLVWLKSTLQIKLRLEQLFVLTLICAVLTNNFAHSPISFFFSILFWGGVIIYRHSPIQVILFSNLSLHLSSLIFGEAVSVFSLILNPFISSIVVAIFPLMMINYLFGGLSVFNTILDLFLSFIVQLLELISTYDLLPAISLSLFTIFALSLLLTFGRYKLAILLLCLQSSSINQHIASRQNFQRIINLGDSREYITSKQEIQFIDQQCKIKSRSIFCKKKPSNYGGPIF